MCKLWDMANELYGFANENFIEEWGVDRFAITFPDAFCEHMEMIIEDNEIEKPLAKFVNICKKAMNEENEAQYQATCPECEKRLCIDTPIMCWNNGEKGEDYDEETVCSECYWECEWYKTDKNEDNQEEIEERVLFKNWIEAPLMCGACAKSVERNSREHDVCHVGGDGELYCVDCIKEHCNCDYCLEEDEESDEED